MKRVFNENSIFNLESRMRKKAAMDLQREMDEKRLAQQVVRLDDNGRRLYTMDSLPPSMIHLGDQNFIQVSCYSGLTRVDIRKYILDDSGCLRPTKDGVSISPDVWHIFSQELLAINRSEYEDGVVIAKKDVCFTKSKVDGKTLITIQRLFQRKDLTLEFMPNRIVLNPKHIEKLNAEKTDDLIFQGIKKALITYTLYGFVRKELLNIGNVPDEFSGDPDNPGMPLRELTDALIKCLKNEFSSKITELFACAACKGDTFSFHKCFGVSAQERFSEYFLRALYTLDWEKAAKNFVQQNVKEYELQRLVFADDFFHLLNIDHVFNGIENLYLEEEDI